jgi:hypothetical protein
MVSLDMNVQQLIKQLQKYPPNMRVIRKGYESGFDDISKVERREIIVNHNDCWWEGKYADPAGFGAGGFSQALPSRAMGDEQALLIA